MCSGSEVGSYLRRIDSCITQLQAHGSSRTCNESKKEEGGEEEEEEEECIQVLAVPGHHGREYILQGYLAHTNLPPPPKTTEGSLAGGIGLL